MSDSAMNSAKARIVRLLDENSFIEIGALVTARSTDFNVQAQKQASDGVITGYGLIEGNPVFVYAQDVQVMGGTMGEMGAAKICNIYDRAMLQGFPVIALIDTGGIRLQEGIDALNGFAQIFRKQTDASGVIPQISAITGNCGGAAAIMASMSDVVYMSDNGASMFVNSPNTIKDNHKDKLDTSSVAFRANEAGDIDGHFSEDEMLSAIRQLVSILPSNNEDKNILPTNDDANRLLQLGYDSDIDEFIKEIADSGVVVELKKDYAKAIMTGFLRLNGQSVGIIANRANVSDYQMCSMTCIKASSFIRFCNCFNIPIITLANVTGFVRSIDEEKIMTRAVSRLASAYAMATVPKITVILDKVYGSPYTVMCSKGLGADLVYAYENSEIGVMDAENAVKIIYPDLSADELREKAAEYSNMQQKSKAAAVRGLIDTVIDIASTRRYLIAGVDMLLTKREFSPVKKHSTL